MLRGWYDTKTGEVCAIAYGLGIATFGGTYDEFLERCRRMDARARASRRDADLGWDANGSPVYASV